MGDAEKRCEPKCPQFSLLLLVIFPLISDRARVATGAAGEREIKVKHSFACLAA